MYAQIGDGLHPYLNYREYLIMLLYYSGRILIDGANQVFADCTSTIDSEAPLWSSLGMTTVYKSGMHWRKRLFE